MNLKKMNTTDCEKIECKLSSSSSSSCNNIKDFNFQGKFDVCFAEQQSNCNASEVLAANEISVAAAAADNSKVEAISLHPPGTCEAEDEEDLETLKEFEDLIVQRNSCEKKLHNNLTTLNAHTEVTTALTITAPPAPPPETVNALLLTPVEQLVSPPTQSPSLSSNDGAELFIADENNADFDDALNPGERWSPLGANYDSSELLSPESELELLSTDSQDKHDFHNGTDSVAEIARLKNLEEEQEMLTTSLMALTSHFAHVQLRVRQIVEAPPQERDILLKDLEEFAFQGIPESANTAVDTASRCGSSAEQHSDNLAENQTADQRQFELIDHLKSQLTELEKLAYESGAPVLPQHILIEKQKIIIDELKQKLNFKVDEHKLPELSAEEIKTQVDNAIGEFVGPLKMKEQLVAQLKTQITDLERFIAYLQCDTDENKLKTLAGNEKVVEHYNSYAAKKKKETTELKNKTKAAAGKQHEAEKTCLETNKKVAAAATSPTDEGARESLHNKAHGLMDKASLLMQMFATTHFGAKPEEFQKNTLKKTNKGNHWGDLRAQLEVDIQEVASLAATLSFDREKLSKIRKAMKKSRQNSPSAGVNKVKTNGVITTIPAATNISRVKMLAAQKQNHLKPYCHISSDDDDISEEDNDYDGPSGYYAWQQQNNKRSVAQCSRFRGDSINILSKELTTAVRKNFSMTLLKLMQHGLRIESVPPVTSSLMVPFMRCLNPSPVFVAEHNYRARDFDASSFMPSTAAFNASEDDAADGAKSDAQWPNTGGLFSTGSTRAMHAWELILEYYYLKHGDEYNNTPARKLSQSFNLDISNSQAVTAKQNLLSVVGSIIAMHRPYKRSLNAHFKAFVCAGLNCHQLVEWLNLIFSCSDLIEHYYMASSYVARTGFRDALRSIDTLTKYDFDLPVDLAVRHFRNL